MWPADTTDMKPPDYKKLINGHDFTHLSETAWKDPDTLRELYVDNQLGYRNIAKMFDGVGDTKVRYQLQKHGIFRPDELEKWPEEDTIRGAYEETGSLERTGDRLGVGQRTLRRLMNHYGIERSKGPQVDSHAPANYHTTTQGYEVVKDGRTDTSPYAVHRLIMIAEHGIDAVKGNVVHHRNRIRWDNRPGNLVLKDHSDHMRRHNGMTPLSIELASMERDEVIGVLQNAGYGDLIRDG